MSNTQQNNWRRKHYNNQGNSHQEEGSRSAAAAGAAAAAATGMVTQPQPSEGTGSNKPLNWKSMTKTQQRKWPRRHLGDDGRKELLPNGPTTRDGEPHPRGLHAAGATPQRVGTAAAGALAGGEGE